MAQRTLTQKDQVQSFRMLACKELREHVFKNSNSDQSAVAAAKEAADSERVERLILKVSTLKKINTTVMEELFFNDAIGNVQIDSIIPSILGSEAQDDDASTGDDGITKADNTAN